MKAKACAAGVTAGYGNVRDGAGVDLGILLSLNANCFRLDITGLEYHLGRPAKFDGMMHDVCVGLGFCGGVVDGEPRHVIDYIPVSGDVTADQFASWVLEAEGMSSGPGDPFWSELRAIFVKHMGSEAIGAEALKSGFC